jgi:battenin
MCLCRNNVLYVIILSAALDLVPSDVPTGVILVADITPSLLVKIGWPYFVKGKIRYARRILSCSALSFAGMMVRSSFFFFFRLMEMNYSWIDLRYGVCVCVCVWQVIVIFSSVPLRLLGISLASVSSGLGEMTFLQLTTRYHGQPGVSWFASGTGAAGVVGAAFWWLLRHLGVQIGLGLSSVE